MVCVLFTALSVSAASDAADNMTVGSEDQTIIEAQNMQEDMLKDTPGTFEDLNNTVHDNSIPQGGTVDLEKDFTFSDSDISSVGINGISISNDITIKGNGYTLNAANNASIFRITNNSHVILENIVFANGNATDGGAIYVESGSTIEIINCTFQNNFASNNGGAIFMAADSLTSTSSIFNSIFTSNHAGNNGGAIFDTLSTINITQSTFSYNNATNYGGSMYIGGAVHIRKSTFDHESAKGGGSFELLDDIDNHSTIENSTFKNCYASGDGGAGYIRTDNVIVENVIFTDNIAGDDGGALYWEGSNGKIYNITCTNNKGISLNTSSTRGGSICLTGSNVTVSKSSFTSSSAYMDEGKDSSKVDGGALFITGNGVIIDEVTFTGCSATNNGGSVYVIGNDTHIYNCDFIGSKAKDGAALYVDGSGCTLYNSTFTNNVADDDGGAIYWQGDNGIMYNITCVNNKGVSSGDSSSRGGTICLTGDNVTVNKSSFKTSSVSIVTGRDSSKIDGGALFITGNNIIVIETEFDDCKATNGGGAVYIIGNNTHLLNCNYTNTQALVGGAIFISGNDAVVDDSLFRYNDAKGATQADGGTGGAIYVDGSGAVISNSDFAYDTSVRYGGSIAVWGPDAMITNNVFDNSSATEFYGGAIFVNGFNATISYSNFTRSKTINAYTRGGAIDVGGDNANILGCNFDDCYSYYGGDIYVNGANAIINGSSFEHAGIYNKKYPYEGGAIFVNGTQTTILKSNFSDFTCGENGGAIYIAGADTNISESNFETCNANGPSYNQGGWGGAIYIQGANTNIEKSNFTLCNALRTDSRGGAIAINGENTIITESHFDNCDAVRGGDIYVFGNYARIEDSTLDESSATYGGAVYLDAWGAVIKGSNITECSAIYSGGAIYVAGGGTNIIDSDFELCRAEGTTYTRGGGAIFISGPDTHISNSDFNDNSVSSNNARGGTIYIEGERTIIDGSHFNESYAGEGGIIYIIGEQAVIDSSTFANSSSRSYGGAISIHGHNATISDSIFENVQSIYSYGGAIFIDGADTNILTSSFYNCVAKADGGAIYIGDVRTIVAYSNFTLSHAVNGGAIYINGDNTTVTYCNLDNNIASSAAGAIQITGTNTLISNSNLNYNTASSAGAIRVTGSNTLISDCNLTYNNATTGSGGGIDLSGRNASVHYSNFYFNDAKMYGGAMNWEGGHGDDSIIGSTFVNNTGHGGGMGGGAIFWTATKGSEIGSGGLIKDSIFINNTAYGHHGGAIDWFHAIDSTIDNCLFINNHAKADGGALYTGDKNGNSLNFTISNCQFYNNSAGFHGGAIANQMANSLIYNNVFDGNRAETSIGGTLLMKENGASNTVVDHCYIYNSYCGVASSWGAGGGAISIGPGDKNITISNCAIINSTANHTYGGAISIRSPDCSLINVTIQDVQTLDSEAGAILWGGDNGFINNVTIYNSSTYVCNHNDKNVHGGAIYLLGSNCQLNDIHITTTSTNINDSSIGKSGYGGAIYVAGSENVISNIEIDDSKALAVRMNAKGGAIYWEGSSGTLINASISNSLANGEGGAIYWKGASATFENISIEYSQTNVTGSNSADGGAIYSTSIDNMNNVYIINALASTDSGDVHGGAIYCNGMNLNNVTVIGSRAATDDGKSYGGAIYWVSGGQGYLINSTFERNTADYGGAICNLRTINVDGTSFIGNVAIEGGAIYGQNAVILTDSTFELNSAKRGGAVYVQKFNLQIDGSTLRNNTAEEKGGAIYYVHKSGLTTFIRNSDLVNNTAFQGSAIYTSNLFELTNVILLDNQANSKEFIEKHVGVDGTGRNYTSAVFVGFDNVLNAIWDEEAVISISCNNVTYWGVNGINVSNSVPRRSDREVWQKVIVEVFNGNGEKINESEVFTDADGRAIYYFTPEEDETYYFAYTHETDRYYTYLRDTLSNRSLVKVYVYNPLYYNQNQTILISLTDGAWGDLNGTVTVKFNDTANTTFIIDVINGTYTIENISGIPIGKYNVTATFDGDIDHTGDTDWTVFEVLPYDDLHITKDVNITADYVNVTDYIKYTINVTNHGPSEGREVNVTEILSPYLKLIKSNATRGSYNYTGGYWYIGDLGVNETVTLTIIAQVIHEGPITNTVWVTGLGNDTNLTNDIDSAHNFTALSIVDLRIVKEINATGNIINVTDTIKYTITVYNDGPCNATGVVVGEVLDYHLSPISINASVGTYANGTWNIGRLNNATNATLTITARVVYSGNVTNEVRVTCFENDTNMSNNYDNVTNLAIAYVDLQIIKEVNVTGSVNVTDKIKFTIHIYNAGPANATGVFVSEILNEHIRMISHNETIGRFDGSTWIINDLNAGEHHNLTIIAEVISAGNITNEVNITSIDNDTNLTNNHDNITNITALPIVDLVIRKEVNVSTVVNVEDIIKFTITVHNNGPCDATNVNVTEKLSKLLKVTENGINATKGTYNQTTGIWTIGDMPAYSEFVLTIICKVMTNGTIANVVAVNSTENDTNTSNNIYNITNITALPIVDLSINKTVNVTSYANVSDIIKFTITVHNAGPSNATKVWFTEKLSPYLKLLNATGPGNYNITSGVWYIGDLKTNETVNLTLVCKITGNGTVINNVNVTSYENDTNTTNNWDGIVFAALPIVDVDIIKTVDINSTVVNFGDKIKFTITVHNKGPSNATGVYVDETLDTTHLKLISVNATVGNYSGNTWTIGKLNNGSTAILTIVCEAVELGNFTNFVEVFSYENDTNTSNNNDTIDNITIIPVVDLDITKTATIWGGTSYVEVGGTVQFIITVVNKGLCDATNVAVVEKLSPLLRLAYPPSAIYNATTGIWYIGNLAKGQFAELILICEVISNGTISNFVSVNSTENDTNMSNNNYTIDNITALPIVNLIITKEVNETVVNVTDKVKYTITVYNDGPSNATKVNVSEVLDKDYLRLISAVTNAGYFNATGGYWYIGNLTNKTRVNLTIECEVIKDGFVYNYVNVTRYEKDTNPYDDWDDVTFKALPIVDVIITKEADFNGSVNVTDIIKFTITVHNRGPSNATSVMVYEILNTTYLRLVSYNSTKGEYNGVSWFVGDLNNGSTEVLNITAEVIAAGNFSNFVNVTSYQNDTNMTNNYANITNITSYYWVDLDITKTASVWGGTSYVLVGGNVQFIINVLNKGPCEARNVTVTEHLADGLKLYSKYTATGNYNETTGIWNIGTMAKNQFAQLIIVATVMKAGNVSNFVSVNSTDNDTNMSNNNYTIDNITALPTVNLIINKEVNQSIVVIGDIVQFNITVTNKGLCNATQVNVTEIINDNDFRIITNYTDRNYYNHTGGYWYIGDLNVNETVKLTIVCEVLRDGIIPNRVEVTSYENDTYPYDNWDIVYVSTDPIVDIIITKESNATNGTVHIYDIIEFNITVHNAGPSDATSVIVAEPLKTQYFRIISNRTTTDADYDGFTWNIGNLAYNATETLTIVCQVVALGDLSNYANVTVYQNDTNTSNNEVNITIKSEPIVDLNITKMVDFGNGTVNVGDYVQFTIRVVNEGPCDATNVTVIEKLSSLLNMTTCTVYGGSYNVTTGIWYIGDLPANASASLTIGATVKSNGTISNFVVVTSNENDTNTSNNNDTIDNITALPVVDLNITKTVNASYVNATDKVSFTITVHNNGPSNATKVNVTEILDKNVFKLISNHTDAGYYNLTGGYWYIGNLNANATVNLTLVCQVLIDGTFRNYVNVTSYENETAPGDNWAEVWLTAYKLVDIVITKEVNVTKVNVTDKVKFTINVTNKGPSNATGVFVGENIDTHYLRLVSSNATVSEFVGNTWVIGNLATGATETLTIICEVISVGNVTNFVFVNQTETDKNESSNNATVNFTSVALVNMTIIKKANVTQVNVGEMVKFTINVTNYGPSNATGIEIIDVLDDRFEFISTNVTWEHYYRVNQTVVWRISELPNGTSYAVELVVRVLGNGTIENVIGVTAHENPDGVQNKTDVNATYLANLTVIKKANLTTVNVGELVKFTINVTNYGPSNATDVNVTDILDSRFEFVSANGTYTRSGQTVIWNITKLPNGTSYIIEMVVRVLGNGTIENIVSVNSTENTTGTENKTSVNATYLNNFTIIKKANVTQVNVGEMVKFTIIVTNYGPSNATNVNVTDILDSRLEFVSTNGTCARSGQTVIWNISKLENNTSYVIELVVRVLGNGTIENIVSVNSTENTTGTENKTSVNATYLNNFTIIKKANVTQVNVGEMVKFTIIVTNYGPSNATDVNVSDVLDSRFEFVSSNSTYVKSGQNIVWNITKLPNGTSYIIEMVVRVLGNGTIENIVSVNSTENTTGTENKTSVNATYLANLTITKKANVTQVNVGEMVKFNIIVTNYGPSNATNVNVTDILDSRFEFVSANGTYTRSGQTVIWNIPKLTNGTSQIIELVVRVLGNGTIENIVSVNSTENTTGTENKTSVNATYLANLTITKKANVTQVNVGEMVKFNIIVTNYGPSNATDVNVSDILDSRFDFVSANGTYTRSGQTVIWNITKLPNGTSYIIELVVCVLGNGTIENIVSVNSTENTTGTENKTSVNATNLVNLTVIKTSDVNVTVVGGLINFTITVTNNGPTNATNVKITDELITEFEFVAASDNPERVTSNKFVWTIAELAGGNSTSVWIQVRARTNGTFTNVAVANSTENTTNVPSNESNVTVKPYVNLTITKTSNVTGQNVSIGDYIKFTITVKNTGLSNATDVFITDELSPAFEFNSTSRDCTRNGQKIIWNIPRLDINVPYTIEIVVKAVMSGFYTNVAVGNSTESENKTSNETTVTVLPAVNITLVKKASVANASVGDFVNFTIIITNHGPSDATNVNITDKLPDGMFYIDSGSNITGVNGTNKNNRVIWNIGSLSNGQSAEVWVRVIVTEVGTWTNTAIVNSTENTTGTSNKTNVTVNTIQTPIDLDCYDIYYGDVETITVTLPKAATGTVNITVGNRTYNNVPISSGVVTLPVYDLGGGSYNVTVVYGGDGTYLPNSTNGTFKVLPLTPKITIEVADIWVGEVEIVNVTVTAPGTVFITVNGQTVEIPLENGVKTTYLLRASYKPDYLGNATWNIYGLPIGTYPAFALYPGNENYTSVNTSALFHVRDKPSTVVVTADDIYVGEDAIIKIQVGPQGVSGSVVVEVEGKRYTLPIDANGRATLKVSGLKAGLKHVKVWYNGTLLYRPSQNATTFKVLKVKPPIDIDAPDIKVGEDGKITVTVPDDATGTITIKINGKTYTKPVRNGNAVFIVKGLKVGVHDIEAYYSGDDKYLPADTTGDINVTPDKKPIDHTPVGLERHATGNPIIVLLLVVVGMCIGQIRRLKK